MTEDWASSMRRRGLAAGTIAARRGVISRWRRYLTREGLKLEAATAADVDRWLDETERTPSARYAAVSHLHMFYRWGQRAGRLEGDPTANVDRPRLKPRLPRPIHPTDLALAISLAGPEMAAALLLGAGCGLRCCEVARLRWDDVHDGRARVMGKGGRERVVPLHAQLVPVLERLERRGVFVLQGWQCSRADNPGQVVSLRVARYLRSYGISATMHQLRHYAGTHALRASHDLRAVQEFLGHASPATTAIYTALDVDDLVRIVDAIPIGGT